MRSPVLAALAAAALMLSSCSAPVVQKALTAAADFQGPRLEGDRFVTFDGAALGLTRWEAQGGAPRAVIIALHGFDDYANAFHLAAPYWAKQGISTYAYDQRGHGRSPDRGVWGGPELMAQDLRTFTALVKAEHPDTRIVALGESMGGAVAIEAFSSGAPPAADALILSAPAVWGWSSQPLPYKTLLWLGARVAGDRVLKPPSFITSRVRASDNIEELRRMGRDPLMIWGARTDALYGLVSLMERAWSKLGRVQVPVLYLYGANDEIIPEGPTLQAARRLKPDDRSAYYAKGWHLLTRDLQGPTVWADIAAYVADPAAPLPSGAPPLPGAPGLPNVRTAEAAAARPPAR